MLSSSPSEWLHHWADQTPDKIAIDAKDDKISFAQLDNQVSGMVAALFQAGVRPGNRVGYLTPTNQLSAMLFLAVMRIGAVAVPLNPLWRSQQVRSAISRTDTHWLIAAPLVLRSYGSAQPSLSKDRQISLFELLDAKGSSFLRDTLAPPSEDGTSLLLFTSGSTGHPKAVMHGPVALKAWSESTSSYLGITQHDRVMGLLSLSFGYGLNQLLVCLHEGATYIPVASQIAGDILQSARDSQATVLASVPRQWRDILNTLKSGAFDTDELSLKCVTNAGGHLAAEVQFELNDALDGVSVVGMYGMTETLRSCYVPPEWFSQKSGSLGRPVPGAWLGLRNEAGKLCEIGETGEILHAGATLSQGYLNAPDASKERFCGTPDWWGGPSSDAKVCQTGDIAYQDDDGFYWFQSRSDRQLKVQGFRFGPHEVEDALLELPFVAEAALMPVKSDGKVELHLAVTPAANDRPDVLNDIRLHLRDQVATYMLPDAIHLFEDGLPRTANQKLNGSELTTLITQRLNLNLTQEIQP